MCRALFVGCAFFLPLMGCSEAGRPAPKRDVSSSVSSSNSSEDRDALNALMGGGVNEAAEETGNDVRLEALTLTGPAGWVRKPAQSSFVRAEFLLPRAQGDDADGRVTISTAGGSIEANIERWKGQFGSAPEHSKQEQIKVGGLDVSLVDFSGDFNDQRGPFAPAVKRSGYRMIAAIIPVAGELHFIKAVGPKKTIEAHAQEIRTFIDTAKLPK